MWSLIKEKKNRGKRRYKKEKEKTGKEVEEKVQKK